MNHGQRPSPAVMTCKQCRDNNCFHCVDVLRSAYSTEFVCTCKRRDHDTDRGLAIMEKELAKIVWGGDQSPC